MRRHAKASSADSTQRQTGRLGIVAVLSFAVCLLMALSAAPALAIVDTCPNVVFRTGPSAKLPECRAYELVSPADMRGQPPSSTNFGNSHSQFAHTTITPNGDKLFFQVQGGVLGEDPGTGLVDRYGVRRTDQGWIPSFEGITGSQTQDSLWYGANSPDLGYYTALTYNWKKASLPDGAYLHTPQGFEVLAKGSLGEFPGVAKTLTFSEIETYMITDGGQHVIFFAPFRLEPEAPGGGVTVIYDRSVGGPTHVISLLPGDVTPTAQSLLLGVSPDARDVLFRFLKAEGGATPWYVRHDNTTTYEVLRPEGRVVGKKLSCAGKPESATLAYQWLRDGAEIGGATIDTYTTTAADEGKTVQCQVTASNADSASIGDSAAKLVEPYAGTNPPLPPSFNGLASGVSVSGSPAVGQLLSCSADGAWKGSPSFSYQWFRGGSEIGGATSSNYTPVSADKGKALQCRVKGTNADGAAVSFSSPMLIAGEFPTATADPTISNLTDPGNAPEAGDQLSCSSGAWSGSPSFAYQWLRDGAEIGGATTAMYALEAADEGKAIQCLVTATDVEGSTQAVSTRVFTTSGPTTETHPFLETFGSAAQPSFWAPTSIAVDQSDGDLLVVDPEAGAFSRFKPDGTPDNFSSLGTNVISSTSEGALEFPSSEERRRSSIQIAVDNSGSATQGNIYVATGTGSESRIDIFAPTGAFLGKIDQYKEGAHATGLLTGFAERACGVAVDSSGNLYAGDSGGFVHKYDPSGAFPTAADSTANFSYPEACALAAGSGATAGFIFATSYEGSAGKLTKLDSSTGEEKYEVASGVATVSVDPSNGHLYAIRGSELEEFDASGPSSASDVSQTDIDAGNGVAVRGSNTHVFVTSGGNNKVSVYGPAVPFTPEAPELIAAGSVEGLAQAGNSLFCNTGSWSGNPTFSRQWLRNGVEIAGATEGSYALTAEDLEKVIQCRVTVTNANGSTVAVNATGSGARYVTPPSPPLASAHLVDRTLAPAGVYGGHIFYTALNGVESRSPGDLYSYDIATQRTTQISPNSEDATFVNISEDGSHVYFISKTEIGGEGEAGKPNLYMWKQADHSTKLIATLGDQDPDTSEYLDLSPRRGAIFPGLRGWIQGQNIEARPIEGVGNGIAESHTESSADGSVLLFTARSQLTAFDNTEAAKEDCQDPNKEDERCLEVYRYDSNSHELTCVSCPPGPGPAHGDARMQTEALGSGLGESSLKAALHDNSTLVQNMTTDTKTVFFESRDNLVPEDTNNRFDVYRWNEDTGLALISTGQGSGNNFLYGVTPSGSDVVFATEQTLLSWDENGGTRRLYDARVDGGFPPPESAVTEPCSGDICQGAPSAAPQTRGAASSSLNGAGNVTQVRCRKNQRRVSRGGKQLCKPRKHRRHRHRRAGQSRRAAR